MKRAHLTIGRPTCSDGRRYISIEIGDRDSSLTVIALEVELDAFAEALTGLGHVPASVNHWVGSYADRVGKHLHTNSVVLPGRPPYGEKEGRAWVLAQPLLKAALADGWELFDDGTRSQQRHDNHRINLRRFEDHPQERAKGVRP